MPTYLRWYGPGSVVFLTWVTWRRRPLFRNEHAVAQLRSSFSRVRDELAFELLAAVVLPDHGHFMMQLPVDDMDYSKRVGRIKAEFTKAHRGVMPLASGHSPGLNHRREALIWQRRFWEHTIRDEADLQRHMDYIHYNPVKHGLAGCPHGYPYSSFERWVSAGVYARDWLCACGNRRTFAPAFGDIESQAGE